MARARDRGEPSPLRGSYLILSPRRKKGAKSKVKAAARDALAKRAARAQTEVDTGREAMEEVAEAAENEVEATPPTS